MLLLGYRYWEGRFSLCSFSSAETCGVGRTAGLLLLKRILLNFQVQQGDLRKKTLLFLSQNETHKTRLLRKAKAVRVSYESSTDASIRTTE
jgi:hypothetical protein